MWCPNFSKFVFRPHFTNLQAQTSQTSNDHTANYIKIPHFTFFTRVLKVPGMQWFQQEHQDPPTTSPS